MTSPYNKALAAIDAAHALDPKIITKPDGNEIAYELHYANKMTHYLSLRKPEASETLKLAIRAQHLSRWEVPRSEYPMTKLGYFSWRNALKKRQAEHVERICIEAGYSTNDAARVAALVRKEDLRNDAETQALEDVACLVFLDDQFEEYEKAWEDEDKTIGILRRTWAKMTEEGRQLALNIEMEERPKAVLAKALSGA
ncbi:hypothetical protein HDK77DRAFT_115017 [Phyllosticta capitalensis]|uniref:Glutamyl-tRNA synthetase n=1 Tax=Phyllosticta capitalensis TaxID=121624 RepID=A0ABR1YPI8_9PEZI